MRLVVTAEAKADIERISDYLAADNPRAADRLVAEFRRRFGEIKAFPNANSLVPGFEAKGIRRKVHGSYLIFYRLAQERIEVIHVVHGARDYAAIIGDA